MRTDIQTDMTKPTVTLRNFVNPPENYCLLFYNIKRNLSFCLKIQFVPRSKHNIGYKNRSVGCTEMFVACSVVHIHSGQNVEFFNADPVDTCINKLLFLKRLIRIHECNYYY